MLDCVGPKVCNQGAVFLPFDRFVPTDGLGAYPFRLHLLKGDAYAPGRIAHRCAFSWSKNLREFVVSRPDVKPGEGVPIGKL
jgi:hypothetical protein